LAIRGGEPSCGGSSPEGLFLAAYVLQTLLQEKTSNGTAPSDEASKREAREEAGRSIRELRKTNVGGPNLSIRDLVFSGACPAGIQWSGVSTEHAGP